MKFEAFAKKFPTEKTCLYLIVGEELFFREQAIQLIRRKYCDHSYEAILFHGHRKAKGEEKLSALTVLDELRSCSLLSSHHLVVVREGDLFFKENREVIGEYFDRPNPKSTLVLELNSLDQRLTVTKQLTAKGILVECKSLYEKAPYWIKSGPKESDLAKWIRTHCQEAYQKTIGSDAVDLLMKKVGNRLFDLDKELEKLSIYTLSERILRTDVDVLVADYKRSKYWDLSDALLEHDTASALRILQKIYQEGVLNEQKQVEHQPQTLAIMIVAILSNDFRRIAEVKEHLKYSRDLKSVLPDIQSNRLEKLKESARAVRNPEQKLQQLLEADLALKSSGADPYFIVEKLMIQLSS
jgi:DNA polymerase III delta subunit